MPKSSQKYQLGFLVPLISDIGSIWYSTRSLVGFCLEVQTKNKKLRLANLKIKLIMHRNSKLLRSKKQLKFGFATQFESHLKLKEKSSPETFRFHNFSMAASACMIHHPRYTKTPKVNITMMTQTNHFLFTIVKCLNLISISTVNFT